MKTIIVGGGPSGMMAAITAAEEGEEVILIEHNDRIGRKLLATGNGRCNLSNERVAGSFENYYSDADDKNGPSFRLLNSIFQKFGYDDTIKFFNELGLLTKSREGLIYPYSDQAAAVLDVLRFRLRALNVTVRLGERVNSLRRTDRGFEVSTDKEISFSDRVILATGSKAQPKLGSDGTGYELLKTLGHSITRITPGLVQLRCGGNFFKSVSGVRVKASLTLRDPEGNTLGNESGELQLTDYGISGIAVMNLSNRLGGKVKGSVIKADFMEDYSQEEITGFLKQKCVDSVDGFAEELLIGIMPKKLGELIIKTAGIPFGSPMRKVTDGMIAKCVSLLKGFVFNIEDTNSFNEAQICLGGVPCDEVDENLQSRIVPGLYIIGELMNVHGICGGFNLQLCWSMGAVAGRALRYIEK